MNLEESHQHSLETLNYIAQLEDYLEGIKNIADMGAGIGYDAVWWASLIGEGNRQFNFNVTAVDNNPPGPVRAVKGVSWIYEDYSTIELPPQDLIWCHNAFQYAINPIGTLSHWHKLLRLDGLLLIELPYKLGIDTHIDRLKVDAIHDAGVYHVHTLGTLILQLACAGFDCRDAHFQFNRQSGWIRAGVYKTSNNPKVYNSWYDLKDANLLPECLDNVIQSRNSFNDTDLVVEWIDRTVTICNV